MALQDKVENVGGFLALVTLLLLLFLHSVLPSITVPLHHVGILLTLIGGLLGVDIANEHRRIIGTLGAVPRKDEDESDK